MGIQITERDNRLLLQFWDNAPYTVGPSGTLAISIEQVLVKEIDITTHIERAVENVLARRERP